ncbi:MAG TPA: hypothetical protein VI547_04870 [Anaerolineales bacterium]|nr:hypothetical protein [Anaerolineales bacterium]HLF01284.1 hypothetical protein [Anaerolineales bacterium]
MKLTNRTSKTTRKNVKTEDDRHAFGVSTINPRMMDTVSYCEKCGAPVQVRHMNAHWKQCVRKEGNKESPRRAKTRGNKK